MIRNPIGVRWSARPGERGAPRGGLVAALVLFLSAGCHGTTSSRVAVGPSEVRTTVAQVALERARDLVLEGDLATARATLTGVDPPLGPGDRALVAEPMENLLTALYSEQSDPALAWALELARQIDAPTWQVWLLGAQCQLATVRRQFDLALDLCGEARAIDAEIDAVWATYILANSVEARREVGGHAALAEISAALEAKLESVGEELPPLSRAGADNELGRAYYELGEYEQALAAFGAALEVYRTLLGETEPDQEEERRQLSARKAAVLQNLANVHDRLDDLDRAMELYLEALELRETLGDDGALAAILRSIGPAYQELGQLDQAHEALLSSLAHARAIAPEHPDRPDQIARTLGFLGDLLLEMGRPAEARQRYAEAFEIYRRQGARTDLAAVESRLALAEHALGRHQVAIGKLEQAAEEYLALGNDEALAEIYYDAARVHRDIGELEEAARFAHLACDQAREVRSRAGGPDVRAGLSATLRKYPELYIEVLMDRHLREPDAGFDHEALRQSEEARAQSLLEVLAASRFDLDTVPGPLRRQRELLIAQASQLDGEIASLESRAGAETDFLGVTHSLENELFRLKLERDQLEGQLQKVELEMREASPRFASLEPETVSAGGIQSRLLDGETILLEYFLGEARSFLWIVTPTELHSAELPGRVAIEETVRDLRDAITRYNRAWRSTTERDRERPAIVARFHSAAASLSEMLLAPLATHGVLGFRRIVIVTDGALQYLPFEALPVPGAPVDDGLGYPPYLIERHEIVRLPSASVLNLQRTPTASPKARPDRQLAIIASPEYLGPIQLPYAMEEARQIAALVPPDQRNSFLDFEASRQEILAARLERYRILHFAAHGEIDTRNPERSHLKLSEVDSSGQPLANSTLSLLDIYNLRLSADLVVLSACDTALGRQVRGEGLIGLTRGFTFAGADAVVASLWKVEDKATAELMVHFYRGLLDDDLPPATALRAAQVAMLRSDRDYPFYWAGFVLQGDWE